MPFTPLRRYRLLAQFWSVAFVVTGLEFAFIPQFLSTQMHLAASLLGLTGHIDLAPGSLWHVIALSLMIAVTMLAWQTARRPEDPSPYVTLQTAKVSSTLMFLFLAATQGSIWLLCALTDGSIALSLFLARRSLAKAAANGGAHGPA